MWLSASSSYSHDATDVGGKRRSKEDRWPVKNFSTVVISIRYTAVPATIGIPEQLTTGMNGSFDSSGFRAYHHLDQAMSVELNPSSQLGFHRELLAALPSLSQGDVTERGSRSIDATRQADAHHQQPECAACRV